jgi:3-methylfumaryl-CoA hydratase
MGAEVSTTRSEILVPGPAEGLAGLLDATDVRLGEGDPLPLLWHWAYLLERPTSAELGPDGHPVAGIASPPAGSRRMWAGGRVTVHGPLLLGRPASRHSEVADRRRREGRSGPLTFVTIRHEISQNGQIAVEEYQDIVYRAPAAAPSASVVDRPVPGTTGVAPFPSDVGAGPPGYRPAVPDTVTLFRMSALTYNSHRIHYDRDYVRAVEGYADLVVHGPLQALYMAEAARRSSPDETSGPTTCSYRMVSPLLLGAGLRVDVESRPHGVDVTVANGAGVVTSSGAFGWGRPPRG